MQSKTIAYIELANNEPSEVSPAFVVLRFAATTFTRPEQDPPHRHNYQEIIVVERGQGRHTIDGQSFDLLPGSVSLITRGQVHVFEEATDVVGWVVRWTDDFLPAWLISQTWNYHTTLFYPLGVDQSLTVTADDLNTLTGVLTLMDAEWTRAAAFQRESALRHLLAVLIIRLERIYQHTWETDQHQRSAYHLYRQFVTLLETDFARHHDVQFYATALQVAPVKLSRIVGRVVGKSTKQLIDERIVLEAKRLLHYTDLSIKEIAVALGYSDLFHLSKTFKRLTGVAPQVFRDQRQKVT